MDNKKKMDLIGELDMVFENLHYAKQKTNNPLIIHRIEKIKTSVSSLMNDIENLNKLDLKIVNPKYFNNLVLKGNNAHKKSNLFNPQGGFKPTSPSYHIKGYED
ncbi:hypothetical protein AWM68_17380 [Fictibacillus phosphorivorans]|uniref:Uncharacterized protein n=1 Tax=Fictibacillus phosphorivorans TaxID=1221500 RepID=A0A163S192_9BACL|nr:hypothetical protein [Fictibacillus phosphorivorans]KZE67944.1 hypothetical protein AWM68_17380 [Fictibacillus phosphorivorans]